jgi:tetratricopeptide (TPR) repeat protein
MKSAPPLVIRLSLVMLAVAVLPAQAARTMLPLSPAATRRLAGADSLLRAGDWPGMFRALEQVARDADRTGDRVLALRARLAHGARLVLAGRERDADPLLRQALQRAIALRDSVAEVHSDSWLAVACQGRGRFAEARRLHERTLTLARLLDERSREAYARVGLGYCDLQAGDLVSAQAHYAAGLDLMHALRDANGECTALIGLGRVATGLGNSATARARFHGADSLGLATGMPGQRAHALNNLGTLEQVENDLVAATAAYRGAFQLHRASGNLREAVTPAGNLADVLARLGRTREALAMLDSLAADCRQRGAADLAAQVTVSRAFALLRADQPLRAIAELDPVLGSVDVPLHIRTNAYGVLASACLRADSTDAGIRAVGAFLDRQRTALTPTGRINLLVGLGELQLRAGRLREAHETATRAATLARRQPGSLALPVSTALAGYASLRLHATSRALRELTAAETLWERIPTTSLIEGSMLTNEQTERLGIALALARMETPRPGADPVEQAFATLQRHRSRTLLRRIHGQADDGAAPDTLTLAGLRDRVLGPGELLLDAYVGQDTSLLFAIRQEDVRLLRLPGEFVLRRLLVPLHELLATPPGASGVGAGDLAAAMAPVERLVLDPLRGAIESARSVTFCPDGALHDLPLEAMRGPGGDPIGLGTPVSRAPSAGILAELRGWPRAPREGLRIAVVGMRAGRGDPSLPGVEQEIDRITRTYAGTTRVQAARSADVVAEFGRCDVLHLAGHAEVDDQRPWRSGLRLVGPSPGERVMLTAADLSRVRSPARLVVLSGCGTAEGQRVPGEGVEGLSSALMIAGVPTVVSTHWPVDDAASATLVAGFYEGLARGESVARALVSGRNKVASRRETRAPFYWAGFIVEGDGERGLPVHAKALPW